MFTTQKQIRAAFKEQCAEYVTSKSHNEQNATVRTEFSFFIDRLRRDGLISERLAARVTL